MINLKSKIIIFDLDDTLYDSRIFTEQGFINISVHLSKILKIKKNIIYKDLIKFSKIDKKKTINLILNKYKLPKKYLFTCIKIYRYSKKNLYLYNDAKLLLRHLSDKNLYLVTDGNKLVQRLKIKSLKLKKYFKKMLITNEYGLKFNKPSIYCFKKIANLEKVSLENLIYIGDNPNKDFLIKKFGVKTVRIKRGIYKNINLSQKYEANYNFDSLDKFKKKIKLKSI